MKILVADDSKTSLELITLSLKKMGHDPLPAMNGEQAINLFLIQRPDLIILDVVMEGMNGYDCAKKIREISTEDWIPIIFLSASIDDESIAKGIEAGGDDYITKPFTEIKLAAKIQAMQRIADMQHKLFETTKKLRVLSSTDVLTGLYNRLQFEKAIKEKISYAKRYNRKLAVLFIDLDNFKIVNDNLGHMVGDLLLKEVASRLVSCVRMYDFVARLGGDEFAIILGSIGSENLAGLVANKIIHALAPSYSIEGHEIHISSSIGIASYPLAGNNSQALIQNADIAMYYAKSLGRNNFQYFTEGLSEKHQKQNYLKASLAFAMERKELFIKYLPIFDLQKNTIIGMEALIYWKHPEFGFISPTVFVPLAEESGIIKEIGSWVLDTVCQDGRQWYNLGNAQFKLIVNISPRQLLQDAFPHFVQDILQKYDIPPRCLELELTETSVMTNLNLSEKRIKEIHDTGVNISIDDFGVGYSFLTQLKTLPISALKIDRSFVKNVTSDPNDAVIVGTLISLGKNLGLNVIAEGIETEEQKQFLIKNGCTQGQGFYLCEPKTAEQITSFLKNSKGAINIP